MAEEAQEQEHRAKGEVIECGCCFDDVTLLKVTYCNGDEPHYFCLDCAQRNASNDIGSSRYELRCMHESGCTATFSRQQRTRFLDAKSIEKLECLQQKDEIRKAELPNLATCPFCDFAAIYPPVEEDREFRCYNPECAEVSCRLCKLKSHIPLTCEESKKENGVSERRVIEEARTEALIRTCGKCKVRILKEDGCNKVICTSCYAVLCDYCGKDITKVMYNHFDGQGRAPPGLLTDSGGKCPLYDESSKRKDQQVDEAEKDAMSKVRAEHPELSEEDLKIKFAKSVQGPPDRHGSMYRHHHRMMRDAHGFQDFDLDDFDAMGAPRARQRPGRVGRQPDVGGFVGRFDELQGELREQQAAVRLAHQNLRQQRQAVQARYQEQVATHHRQQAAQAQRMQQAAQVQRMQQAQIAQLNQQRRAQLAQVRAQRQQQLAQQAAQAPAPATLSNVVPNPFNVPAPFWNGGNNDPFGGQSLFGGDNGAFNGNAFGFFQDVPAFNNANYLQNQPANQGSRAEAQNLNTLAAQSRNNYATLQANRAPQQPQYNPYAAEQDPLFNDFDFEGFLDPPRANNDQPPATAYNFQF